VFLWIALNSLQAQGVAEFLTLTGRDAEEVIPEEDALLLEELMRDPSGLTEEKLAQMTQLSFLSANDIRILQTSADSGWTASLPEHQGISDRLRELLNLLAKKNQVPEDPRVRWKQTLVSKKDIRYQWRGHITFPSAEIGMFIERDPGEKSITDRSSGYLVRRYSKGRLILGDHQIVTGYGLMFWRSVPVRKGFETITTLARAGQGLQPYRSSHESWNLRGAGLTYDTPWGEGLVSLGYNLRDGYIDTDGEVHTRDTGLHTGEMATTQKGKLHETSIVGQWSLRTARNQIGLALVADKWRDVESKHQLFRGYSIFGSHRYGSWLIFGESAAGFNDTRGYLVGGQTRSKVIHYLFAVRSYAPGFRALRSNPFAEWTGKERKETGLYQGLMFRKGRHKVTLYGDLYVERLGKNATNFPRRGVDSAWRWEGKWSQTEWRIQWKEEIRTNEGKNTYFPRTIPAKEQRRTFKITVRYKRNRNTVWKCDWSKTKVQTGRISAAGQGINLLWFWRGEATTITLDWVTTVIDDYKARIYFWDVNLPGEMRSRMYVGSGHAPGAKILYRSREGFKIGARYRVTWPDLHFAGDPVSEGALVAEFVL